MWREVGPRGLHDVASVTSISDALGRRHAVAVLAALHADGPMGATALSTAVGAAVGGGLAVAKHLESHGLVRLEKSSGVADKPSYAIAVTPAGARLAEALLAYLRDDP